MASQMTADGLFQGYRAEAIPPATTRSARVMTISLQKCWYLWEEGGCGADEVVERLSSASQKSTGEWADWGFREQQMHADLSLCRNAFERYKKQLTSWQEKYWEHSRCLQTFPEDVITVRDSGDIELARRRFSHKASMGKLEQLCEDYGYRCQALARAALALCSTLDGGREAMCSEMPSCDAPYALLLHGELMKQGYYLHRREAASSLSTTSVV